MRNITGEDFSKITYAHVKNNILQNPLIHNPKITIRDNRKITVRVNFEKPRNEILRIPKIHTPENYGYITSEKGEIRVRITPRLPQGFYSKLLETQKNNYTKIALRAKGKNEIVNRPDKKTFPTSQRTYGHSIIIEFKGPIKKEGNEDFYLHGSNERMKDNIGVTMRIRTRKKNTNNMSSLIGLDLLPKFRHIRKRQAFNGEIRCSGRVHRIIKLIGFLNEFRSYPELAKELGITTRSVGNYLNLLCQLGFSIDVAHNKRNYYRLTNTKEVFGLNDEVVNKHEE
ncbi:hypothetical protein [Aureisphaera sp.]